MAEAKKILAVRVTDEILMQLDGLALRCLPEGFAAPRSSIARMCLVRGIAAIEAEAEAAKVQR